MIYSLRINYVHLLILFVGLNFEQVNSLSVRVTHKIRFHVYNSTNLPDNKITIGLFGEIAPNAVRYYYKVSQCGFNYGLTIVNFLLNSVAFTVLDGDLEPCLPSYVHRDRKFVIKSTDVGLVQTGVGESPYRFVPDLTITTEESLLHDSYSEVFGKVLIGMDVLYALIKREAGCEIFTKLQRPMLTVDKIELADERVYINQD